jgi:cell division protein FtsB
MNRRVSDPVWPPRPAAPPATVREAETGSAGAGRDPRLRILSRARSRHAPSSIPRDPFSGEELFLRRVWRSTRIQWHRFAVVAFVIWAAYALALSPHGALRLAALKRTVAAEEQLNATLAMRRDSLDQVMARIDRGEKSVLEERARNDFGFAGPNERVYRLPADAEDDHTRSEAEIRGGDRFSDRSRQALTTPAGGK